MTGNRTSVPPWWATLVHWLHCVFQAQNAVAIPPQPARCFQNQPVHPHLETCRPARVVVVLGGGLIAADSAPK